MDLVKYLPTWLPGMGFKRDALIAAEDVQEAVNAPFDFVKSELVCHLFHHIIKAYADE